MKDPGKLVLHVHLDTLQGVVQAASATTRDGTVVDLPITDVRYASGWPGPGSVTVDLQVVLTIAEVEA